MKFAFGLLLMDSVLSFMMDKWNIWQRWLVLVIFNIGFMLAVLGLK